MSVSMEAINRGSRGGHRQQTGVGVSYVLACFYSFYLLTILSQLLTNLGRRQKRRASVSAEAMDGIFFYSF